MRQWIRSGLEKLTDPMTRVAVAIACLFIIVLSVSQYIHIRLHKMSVTAALVNHTGKLRYLLKSYESELGIVQLNEHLEGGQREIELRAVSLEFQRRYINLSTVIKGELDALEFADKIRPGFLQIDKELRGIYERYDHSFDVNQQNHLYFRHTFDDAVEHVNTHIEFVSRVYQDQISFYEVMDTSLLISIFVLLALLYVLVVQPSFRALADRNRQLEDAIELNSVLISFASHQFKTPLTIIANNVELLKLSLARGTFDKLETVTNRIDQGAKKFNEVIQTFFYMDARKVFDQNELENVTIYQFVKQIVEDNSPDGESCKVVVALETEESEWLINAEAYKYILTNLVSNAIKYSPADIQPEVELSADAHYYVTKVKDWGIGMPAEEIKDLFKPYKRMSNASIASGTGLGMFIVKTIADKVGALLEVTSEHGKGTLITLKLPKEEKVRK